MIDSVDPKLIETASWRQPLGSQRQPNEIRRMLAISFVVHLVIVVPLMLVRSAQSFREKPEAVAVTLVEPPASPQASREPPRNRLALVRGCKPPRQQPKRAHSFTKSRK